MATTMQQLVDRARKPLNDNDKVRWPDATLLEYANDALLRLRSKRPDLFFGQFLNLPGAVTLANNFPLGDEFIEPVADYLRARAHTHDTEAAEEEKVAMFSKAFLDIVGA